MIFLSTLSFLLVGIGFAQNISTIVAGHWSREKKLEKDHFNFPSSDHHNVTTYSVCDSRNNPCTEKFEPIQELATSLVQLFTYRAQHVI